jgi:hypothetical protein
MHCRRHRPRRAPCGLASRRGSTPSWEGRGPYPGCEISSLLDPRNSARSEYVHSASNTRNCLYASTFRALQDVPFVVESSGTETQLTNGYDPNSRARQLPGQSHRQLSEAGSSRAVRRSRGHARSGAQPWTPVHDRSTQRVARRSGRRARPPLTSGRCREMLTPCREAERNASGTSSRSGSTR